MTIQKKIHLKDFLGNYGYLVGLKNCSYLYTLPGSSAPTAVEELSKISVNVSSTAIYDLSLDRMNGTKGFSGWKLMVTLALQRNNKALPPS